MLKGVDPGDQLHAGCPESHSCHLFTSATTLPPTSPFLIWEWQADCPEGPKGRMPETAEKQWRCVLRPHGNREQSKLEIGRVQLAHGRIQAWVRALALGSSSLWALERQRLRGESRVAQSPGIATKRHQVPRSLCCSFSSGPLLL